MARARYFVLRSLNLENINKSLDTGVWATQPHNEEKLQEAYAAGGEVLLVFSVNGSGQFQGYARMAGPIRSAEQAPSWEGDARVGAAFPVEWVRRVDLPHGETDHLRNPWNESKPVRLCRDGTEVEPGVGAQLVALLDAAAEQQGPGQRQRAPPGGMRGAWGAGPPGMRGGPMPELEGLPLGAGLGGMMPPDLALLAGMNPLLLGGAFGPAGMAAGSGFGMGAGFGAGMMMMDDFRGPPLVERPPPPPPRREGPYDRPPGGYEGPPRRGGYHGGPGPGGPPRHNYDGPPRGFDPRFDGPPHRGGFDGGLPHRGPYGYDGPPGPGWDRGRPPSPRFEGRYRSRSPEYWGPAGGRGGPGPGPEFGRGPPPQQGDYKGAPPPGGGRGERPSLLEMSYEDYLAKFERIKQLRGGGGDVVAAGKQEAAAGGSPGMSAHLMSEEQYVALCRQYMGRMGMPFDEPAVRGHYHRQRDAAGA